MRLSFLGDVTLEGVEKGLVAEIGGNTTTLSVQGNHRVEVRHGRHLNAGKLHEERSTDDLDQKEDAKPAGKTVHLRN